MSTAHSRLSPAGQGQETPRQPAKRRTSLAAPAGPVPAKRRLADLLTPPAHRPWLWRRLAVTLNFSRKLINTFAANVLLAGHKLNTFAQHAGLPTVSIAVADGARHILWARFANRVRPPDRLLVRRAGRAATLPVVADVVDVVPLPVEARHKGDSDSVLARSNIFNTN